MKQKKRLAILFLLFGVLSCSNHTQQNINQTNLNQTNINESNTSKLSQSEPAKMTKPFQNPLLKTWSGPYSGVPAFTEAKLTDLKPALEEAMKIKLAEIATIANNPAPPSFENTIVELERSGKALDRVSAYWGIWNNNLSSPEFRAIQTEMVPKLSSFRSKINQNTQLFERVKSVYQSDEMKNLLPAQQRLTYLTYHGFAHHGANLKGTAKKRYAEINQRLAELQTQFSNNILADEEKYVHFLNKNQLSGLPESYISAAAEAAKARGKSGQFAITNTRSSMSPFLTYSNDRELRKKVWETYYSRGDNQDKNDNNALISEILKLRHERVGLLGYSNYSTWRLKNRMAKNPENAMKLMESVWPAAIKRVDEEVADMQALADKTGFSGHIMPWDYRYYAEKVRKDKYDLNSNEIKQYLQLDKLREAMFYVAGELFHFNFSPIETGSIEAGKVPVYHPDVKVWEVTNRLTGQHIGLWYLDPFTRTGKQSGAWATSFRSHSTFDGKNNVLATNNSNFVKGPAGQPLLISWDDAETFFHEFGHALHYLSSNVAYPTLNNGVRDYTEFQSQLLERWLMTDEVINNYLVHYKTGKPMPATLVSKIKKAARFNQGFKTTEYLASALVDLKLHTSDPTNIDPDTFERETLKALKMPKEVVMRHRTPHFGHIFSSEGYSSGYYGYLWAEVLTSDAAEAFTESPGGFYDKAVAEKLVKHLFSIRNSIDPADAYRQFRGRDANVNALMKDRGFLSSK